MAVVMTESAEPANLPLAKEIAEVLAFAYPEHSWKVRIDGGLVIINNLNISTPWCPVGMVRKYKDLAHDAMERKRNVIFAAGELLERAHMRRAAYDGQTARVLEGGAEFKWRPDPARAN